jgi:hypothetical protein
MRHAGHKRLLKRIIIGPFRKGSVDSCVVDCRLTMDVFRYRQALPLHPGIEDPQDEIKEAVIAQFTLRTSLGHREVREDNPTASLYSALCRTPFSVRQIGPVIAPLHPGHELEDRLKRIRAQG